LYSSVGSLYTNGLKARRVSRKGQTLALHWKVHIVPMWIEKDIHRFLPVERINLSIFE
jgi:hypothetical protein